MRVERGGTHHIVDIHHFDEVACIAHDVDAEFLLLDGIVEEKVRTFFLLELSSHLCRGIRLILTWDEVVGRVVDIYHWCILFATRGEAQRHGYQKRGKYDIS